MVEGIICKYIASRIPPRLRILHHCKPYKSNIISTALALRYMESDLIPPWQAKTNIFGMDQISTVLISPEIELFFLVVQPFCTRKSLNIKNFVDDP